MNKIPNRQAMCDALLEAAQRDGDIVALCSDSRGSASLTPFAQRFPERFVEVGIAEQNLVSVAAGLARWGKRPFAASPASFLTTRSLEQIKVDVAYSRMNVKLVGISGGVSYGALGMTHHALQDIAAIAAIPGTRVYLPSDRFQTAWLTARLCEDDQMAYVRLGRSAVEDVYTPDTAFAMDQAVLCHPGQDAAIIACGEMVRPALDAALALEKEGLHIAVADMYCLKPLDTQTLARVARQSPVVFTVEEHVKHGGLGSMVSQFVAENAVGTRVVSLALPDAPVITGSPADIFRHYGLDAQGIQLKIKEIIGAK